MASFDDVKGAHAGKSALIEGRDYEFRAQLARQARAIVRRAMRQLVAHCDVNEALAAAGVDHLDVKEATSGAIAYPYPHVEVVRVATVLAAVATTTVLHSGALAR